MATILLPKSTFEILELAEKIIQKCEQSENREVRLIQSNIQDLKNLLTEARPLYQHLQLLKADALELNTKIIQIAGSHNQFRKITPGTMRFSIAQIRDILKGHYREKKICLREWGFTVHTNEKESNPPEPFQKPDF